MGMAVLVADPGAESTPPEGDRRPWFPSWWDHWTRWQLAAARALSSLVARDDR